MLFDATPVYGRTHLSAAHRKAIHHVTIAHFTHGLRSIIAHDSH
jgi:hypothetical protein